MRTSEKQRRFNASRNKQTKHAAGGRKRFSRKREDDGDDVLSNNTARRIEGTASSAVVSVHRVSHQRTRSTNEPLHEDTHARAHTHKHAQQQTDAMASPRPGRTEVAATPTTCAVVPAEIPPRPRRTTHSSHVVRLQGTPDRLGNDHPAASVAAPQPRPR